MITTTTMVTVLMRTMVWTLLRWESCTASTRRLILTMSSV